MNKFEAIRIFTKVVQTHGFTAAGRELGLSRSAVSKYVTQLEDNLGAQLLNRSTRFVSPTETGAAFYDRCITILADLNEAEKDVAELQGEPRGTIRLNAPMSFGTLHLSSAIADFISAYPEVRIETTLNDRFIDPVQEGFDLTIRIADLPDSSLIARKIAPAKRILCAAPDYIHEKGEPTHPNDLKYHSCLHYGYLPTGNTWHFENGKGRHSVLINGVLCSNNGEFLMASAIKGLGIALLPSFMAGAELQAGRLVSVLNAFRTPKIAIYAIYPPNRHLSAKIRLLIDFLSARFGDAPYWDLVS